jgi:hypothetical protein
MVSRISWKKTIGVIALTIGLTISAIYLAIDLSRPYMTPLSEKYFQLIGVDVKDQSLSPIKLWTTLSWPKYLQKENPPGYQVIRMANWILSLSRKTGNLLNRTFGNVFIDWNTFPIGSWVSNCTLYIAITDPSLENIDLIEQAIGRHEMITFVFIKVRATYAELKRCLRLVNEKHKVIGAGIGVTRDAGLYVGLPTVSFWSVNIVLLQLQDIPRSIIVVRKVPQVTPI